MSPVYGVEVAGKTVLDVGGYDGHVAQAALDSGAREAVVVDNEEWRIYGWGEGRAAGEVRFIKADFLDYHVPADVVFCLYVIYHLQDPWAGLAQLRRLTKDTLVLASSFVSLEEAEEGGWRFYPDGSGHPNGTVWWRPTREALIRDAERAGFKLLADVSDHRAGDEIILRMVPC